MPAPLILPEADACRASFGAAPRSARREGENERLRHSADHSPRTLEIDALCGKWRAAEDVAAATMTDIGEVAAGEATFRDLFDSNPVPMVICDEGLRFLAVNDAAAELWSYSREALLAMSAYDIQSLQEREIGGSPSGLCAPAAESGCPWRNVKADGSQIEAMAYSRTIAYRGRRALLVTLVDVTEKRRAEMRIAYMAHHDALTDLPNRVLFRLHLDEALLRMRRDRENLAILYLDLDQFKSVNDTLGHSIGDALLQVVADRLRECLCETAFAARLGGDEFAIIRTGLQGPEEASGLATRLVEAVSRPYDIDGHHVEIGTSIGVALSPSDGETSDQLLKNADMALFRAKEDGRRTFRFFEPEMDARARARRSLELDLRKALIAGELELHYQPLVCLQNGAITGFEALARWRHPLRGMLPPAEFIPFAEEIGLIAPLGEWALRQACAEAATWPNDLKVAVNLSSVQFQGDRMKKCVTMG